MKKLLVIVQLMCITVLSLAQSYDVFIDLTNVKNDKVPVEIEFNDFSIPKSIEFQMPKMVPGTYSISDFGRTLSDFKAFDNEGSEIEVNRIDDNRWLIESSSYLARVNYLVDDTFDGQEFNNVFEPGGTNIQADTNFVINTFGFIGYLEDMSALPYQIKVKHPKHLYGASPLNREVLSETEEIFSIDNYFQLTDSPIMYSAPDTASVMVGKTKVMVSVYSPGKKTDADFILNKVEPTLIGAGEYLGGDLPVYDYLIMVHLLDKPSNSGGYGALEHSYSTVFVLPDVSGEHLAQTLVDVTAHEFFHIITPLTIHSEEIGNYNFINPKMSKHLWLYEGVTEYSSMHMQVMYGLVTPDEFLDVINQKLDGASGFDDNLPFTEMSLGALDKYKNQYTNVYEKGALIGMCLDLKLLELSDGNYGIRELLQTLSETYGIERSFEDDKLFDEITELTYPNIRDFFTRFVEGTESLPFTECLAYAGVNYEQAGVKKVNTLGQVGMGFDPDRNMLVIVGTDNMNSFGEEMGYENGDYMVSINDSHITPENFNEVYEEFLAQDEGEKVTVAVLRKNKKGIEKEKKLKGRITTISNISGGNVSWDKNPTEQQMLIRNSWLNHN